MLNGTSWGWSNPDAGEPPFTGPTAQAVIARRFTSHERNRMLVLNLLAATTRTVIKTKVMEPEKAVKALANRPAAGRGRLRSTALVIRTKPPEAGGRGSLTGALN